MTYVVKMFVLKKLAANMSMAKMLRGKILDMLGFREWWWGAGSWIPLIFRR